MSFFDVKKNAEDVKQSDGAYINRSGMYEVIVLAPTVSVSKNGATTVDLFVNHDGKEQIVYGNMRLTNNNGDENKIGSKTFNQLVIIADVDNVADPVEMDLPIGKKGADKSAAVLEDLMDIEAIVRIQMEYSLWNNAIQEKKIIKGFYRNDKASAEEIVMETDIGVQYEKDLAYADNVTYKDDLTEEDIIAWVKGGRKGNTGASAATSKKPSLGKKRFGEKKG